MTLQTNKKAAVLLIVDNEANAVLFKNSLDSGDRAANLELLWVDRLSEGVELATREDIAVVVLDLMLPDSGGLGSVQRVRQANHDVPILILSSVYDRRLAAAALRAGAEGFLVKNAVTGRSAACTLHSVIERGRVGHEGSKTQHGLPRHRLGVLHEPHGSTDETIVD